MATRSADGSIKLNLKATITNLLDDGTSQSQAEVNLTVDNSYDDGVQSGEFNRAIKFQRTITSGNNENIDLAATLTIDIGAGAGKDALGVDWDIEEIVSIAVVNEETSAGRLDITTGTGTWLGAHSGASNGLNPGDFVAKAVKNDGVASGAGHVYNFAAVGGDVTYTVIVYARDDTDDSSSSSQSSDSTT